MAAARTGRLGSRTLVAPSKIAGKRLAPYLALRHDELEKEPPGLPVTVEVPSTAAGG